MNFLFVGCSTGLGLHHIFRDAFSSSRSHFDPVKDNVKGQIWEDDRDKYINLSAAGSGNRYITNSMQEHISSNGAPDYVFLQYSGLNRIDLPCAKHDTLIDYGYQTETEFSNWIHSGGMTGSWLGNRQCWKLFYQLYNDADQTNIIAQNLFEIENGINFLKLRNIPFNWSTYYDYYNPPNDIVLQDGRLCTATQKIYDDIDKSHKVQSCIVNHIASKNPEWLYKDRVHWKHAGGMDWLNNFKNQFIIKDIHATR
jgi:hypothetical protein